jgi:hypothetical protein
VQVGEEQVHQIGVPTVGIERAHPPQMRLRRFQPALSQQQPGESQVCLERVGMAGQHRFVRPHRDRQPAGLLRGDPRLARERRREAVDPRRGADRIGHRAQLLERRASQRQLAIVNARLVEPFQCEGEAGLVSEVLQRPHEEMPTARHRRREGAGQHRGVAPELVHASEQAQHDDPVPLDRALVDSRVGRSDRLDVEREGARIQEAPRPMDASRDVVSRPPQIERVARAGAERCADAVLQLLDHPIGIVDARGRQRRDRFGRAARSVEPHGVEVG